VPLSLPPSRHMPADLQHAALTAVRAVLTALPAVARHHVASLEGNLAAVLAAPPPALHLTAPHDGATASTDAPPAGVAPESRSLAAQVDASTLSRLARPPHPSARSAASMPCKRPSQYVPRRLPRLLPLHGASQALASLPRAVTAEAEAAAWGRCARRTLLSLHAGLDVLCYYGAGGWHILRWRPAPGRAAPTLVRCQPPRSVVVRPRHALRRSQAPPRRVASPDGPHQRAPVPPDATPRAGSAPWQAPRGHPIQPLGARWTAAWARVPVSSWAARPLRRPAPRGLQPQRTTACSPALASPPLPQQGPPPPPPVPAPWAAGPESATPCT
jgi:hypothetical protein